MHSFAPSLSFLLSFFLLPLLHWPQIGVLATFDSLNSQPAAVNRGLGLGLQLASAAEIHRATKFEPESESLVFQDNASNGLTEPGRDADAPPTRHSGTVNQVEKSDVGLGDHKSGGGHSHLIPPSVVHRKHAAAVNRARKATPGNDTDVVLLPGKRAAGAKFTNYVTGLGACGGFNHASDFVVALDTQQWDNGAHCYTTITITINGKSTQAQIVDECMGCGFNNIDLTDGLFGFWADISQVGTLYGDWEWGSGTQPTPTPTPTPKTTQRPTTTSKPATTSSAVVSSSSAANTSSAISNSATAPAPTQSVQSGNLELMYLSTVGMGGLLMGTLNFTN